MGDVYKKSLELHKEHRGKIEVSSKVPLKSREDLSLAYTPGVAEVSRQLAKDPASAREYSIKRNTVAVVSDGSAVLGLGDIGPLGALPVMEGKAALFKEFGGVDAWPLCLDTQDTEEIIKTVKLIAPVFGGINLEDIGAPRCFEIEDRLKSELGIPVMHDDQHGTAVVVLAGLINALKLRGTQVTEAKLVINGVGAAGVATTKLLLAYGFKHIILSDSQGAIYEGRDDLNAAKAELAKLTNLERQTGSIKEIICGQDVFIGVSKAGLLSKESVQCMNERPIIFAMANPEPEIMPDLAREAGAYIIATGRSDFPNQVNNVLAFPGIFRGVLDSGKQEITQDMLTAAAEAIASYVSDSTPEQIIPDPLDRGVAQAVAEAVKG